MNLKKYTRLAVIAVFIIVIIIAFSFRMLFVVFSDLITGGLSTAKKLVSVTEEGVGIADYIHIDSNGVKIGDNEIIFSELGDSISGALDSIENKIPLDNKTSFVGNSVDVTELGFTQNRYSFDSSVNRSLDIDVDNCDVVIVSGEVDEIIVDVLESEEFGYEFKTSDNTLEITEKSSESEEKILNLLGFKLSLGKKEHKTEYTGLGMIVYIPESFCGEIEVETSNGDVKVGNMTLEEELNIITSNGKVNLYNVSAYDIEAMTSDGAVELSELSATEIDVSTSNARVNLANLTAKRLFVTTSAASIDFTHLFGEKFVFNTSNGDINGSILGSESLFSIETNTDRSATPKSKENDRAQYRLEAATSGGDIMIKFVE